ncbi:putative outer membrane protein [Pedobacter sp. BAL39]|uniref:SusC/RagA family TonB-linked outer membrane protein n=1 Tax=Pedobacter sp. BAL39 TaxID=391596 RepID=UPI000155A6A2|nr:SusC/RagA family TonB-linked outer membrane protein [Pedobacter sp. BAL39]EDM34834.1 putative outer membrane protein [Pedobacter sp. BAL39]
MRWIIFFILMMAMLLCREVKAQTRVSLHLRGVGFERVIDEIKKQTSYRFVYNQEKLPSRPINISVNDEEVLTVLKRVLSGTGYRYTLLSNELIAISALTMDRPKDSLSGSNQLNEVVITALNIPKEERKVGYAVATVPAEIVASGRESNFVLSLEGRVAGLNVSGASGGPASSSRLLLRGAASMNATSPLFVLNGIPIDNSQRGSATEYGGADYGDGISNLNPDDIESITILKGSAASALYGARAANGVILVTTKSAKKNDPLSVDYQMNLSIDRAVNNTDYQYTYGQGIQNKRPFDVESAIASGLSSWGEPLDGQPVIQLDGNMYPYLAVKNNIASFYRTAPALTNTVSLSGGSPKAAIRLSASNMDHASTLPRSGLGRKTINLNTTYQIHPKLTLNFNGNYIYELNKNRSYLSDGPMNANYGIQFMATSLRESLLAPGYNAQTGIEQPWSADEYKTNPYFVVNKQVNDSKRNRFISSATAKYQFTDDIYLQGRFGYDISNDHLLDVLPSGTSFTISQQGALNGLYQIQTTELNTDLLLGFRRHLGGDVELNVSTGGNFRRRNVENLSYIGSRFITPGIYIPSNLQSISSNYSVNRLATQSLYYTADLSYGTLNLSTTGRYDIYSTLPSGNRGIFVPGFSGSFVFSDLFSIPAMDYGKLRMSVAGTSGEPVLPYTTRTYYSSNIAVGGIPLSDFSRVLANYNLKPFSLNEFEVGLNTRFFNNRAGMDLTWFHRITRNEITTVEQSVTTGFTSSYANLGKTRNMGTELLLYGTPVKSDALKLDVSLNLSHINNKLLSIDGSSRYILTGKYRPLNANTAMVTGESITQIMAYDYKRDAQGRTIVDDNGIPMRGDFKPMGGTLPVYYGGLSSSLQFRKMTLSFLVDFKFGNKVLSASEHYSYVYGLNKATLEGRETGVVADGVHSDGSINQTSVPAYLYYPQLVSNISALSVLNGSFIKFRELQLGYLFGTPEKLRAQSLSIALYARNLFTILKYTDNIDPESQFSPNLSYAGIEGASLPVSKTYGLRVHFKF